MTGEAHRNLGDVLISGEDPARPALIDLSRPGEIRRFTFGELDRGASAVGSSLLEAGFRPGETIGVLSANSAEFLLCMLGTMRAGLITVPINHRLPDEQVAFICHDAGVRSVFADSQNRHRCPPETRVLEMTPSHQVDAHSSRSSSRLGPGSPARMLYTSGSTGRPKGVILSHHSQWSILEGMGEPAIREEFAGQRGIVAAPLFHMNALVFSEFLLLCRGTIVLMDRFRAVSFLEAIAEYRVRILTGVPTMVALAARETEVLERLDLSCVELVYIGSAPLSDTIVETARRLFPGAEILNGYGTTETGAGNFGSHPDGIPRPPLSFGYPRTHVEVRLSGGKSASEGVLEIRSPTCMTGYQNLPELTADTLKSGWISTGDLARRDRQGFYYFVGRADDMFVCSGENIYPGQVERLMERHPHILEVCVVPAPDEIRGQIPVAFVVRKTESALTEKEVQKFVLQRAAPHLHPRRVYFLDRMPLAGTNKIDRRHLEDMAAVPNGSSKEISAASGKPGA